MVHTGKPDLVIKSGINYFQKSFYYLYILVAVITFSPSKLIAYFPPFIFLIGLILIWPSDQMFRKLLTCLLFAGIIISFYGIIYPYMILQNAVLALLTYSSFIPIFVIPSRMLASEILFQRILAFNQKLLLIEGIVGIIQAFYGALRYGTFSGANGDAVQGTINPSLDPNGSFANPMFAVNLSFLCLLALIAVVNFRYRPYPLIVGALSIVLASVVHALLLLILAVLIIVLLNCNHLFKNPKTLITFLISIVLFLSAAFYFIGGNIGEISQVINRKADLGDPKASITDKLLYVVPKEYPAMPYIGLGPGQFSSRASLMGSGHFFGGFYKPKPVPLLTPQVSAPMKEFLIPIWSWSAHIAYFGSTQQPYCSWLSIYSEFGLLGSFIVISMVAFFLLKAKFVRISKSNILYSLVFQIGVLFLFFLGYQENYWEVAQAIFIGLILLKLLYAKMFYSDINITTPMPKRLAL